MASQVEVVLSVPFTTWSTLASSHISENGFISDNAFFSHPDSRLTQVAFFRPETLFHTFFRRSKCFPDWALWMSMFASPESSPGGKRSWNWMLWLR